MSKNGKSSAIETLIYNFFGKEEPSGYIDLKTKKGLLVCLIEQHKISPGKKHKCYEVHKYLIDNGYLKEEHSGAAMVPVCNLLKDAKNYLNKIIEGQPTEGYCFKRGPLSDELISDIIYDYPHL